MRPERVDIVGAGGIGATIGLTLLLASGLRVRFVDTNPQRLAIVSQVPSISDRRFPPPECLTFDEWQPAADAWIFLCVKCYDNATVLAKIPRTATLIPIQNGFDRQLEAWDHAVEGIASFVAKVRSDFFCPAITRSGDLHFGPRRRGEGGDILATLKTWFGGKRGNMFSTQFVSSILPIKNTKLMYNAAISPLAAAAGIDNGELLSHPAARRLFFALLKENYAILSRTGCELGTVGPFHPRTVMRILNQRWLAWLLAKRFEPSLRGTYCSMAGEIERGRTEIDNYTGYLLHLAEGRVDAPCNRAVYDLVTRLQAERTTPNLAVLDTLHAAVR